MRHFRYVFFLFIFLSIAFPAMANAKTVVAQVIAVQGQAYVQEGKQPKKVLKRAQKIYQGDTISTQKDAKVQVRFTDGTMVSLKPTTNFRVDEYHFKDAEKEKYAVTLIEGGLRSVTGTIGKNEPLAFTTKTPVATIGVRGTDFIASYSTATKLHVQVEDGTCSLQNDAGTFVLEEGHAMNVASNDAAPVDTPYSAAEAEEYAVHDDGGEAAVDEEHDQAAANEEEHDNAAADEEEHDKAADEEEQDEAPVDEDHDQAAAGEEDHSDAASGEEAAPQEDSSSASSGSDESHE